MEGAGPWLKSTYKLEDSQAKPYTFNIQPFIADKNSALEKLFRHHGLYERDNEQKTDPLTSLLHAIAGGNGSAFKPVADDPEREEQGED